jgi:hypothetical protein
VNGAYGRNVLVDNWRAGDGGASGTRHEQAEWTIASLLRAQRGVQHARFGVITDWETSTTFEA